MSQPYCGKSCDSCGCKMELACPGCHEGPGRKAFGDCTIAACCRQRCLDGCSACGETVNCAKYRMRMDMPLYRQGRKVMKAEQSAELDRSAPILGKYIRWLFWLLIVNAAGNVFLEFIVYFPVLSVPGILLRDVSTIISGVILLKISGYSGHFKTGGWCTLLSGIGSLLGAWVGMLFLLPAMVLSCVGAYHEIHGYAQVTRYGDPALADLWRKLWIGYVVLLCAAVVIFILLFALPVAGVTLTQGLVYGRIAAYLAKQILLHKTAQGFQNHRPVEV